MLEDYTIISGFDSRRESAQAALVTEVKFWMARGWQPIGGVVFVGTETHRGFTCLVYCQAMVKASDAAIADPIEAAVRAATLLGQESTVQDAEQ